MRFRGDEGVEELGHTRERSGVLEELALQGGLSGLEGGLVNWEIGPGGENLVCLSCQSGCWMGERVFPWAGEREDAGGGKCSEWKPYLGPRSALQLSFDRPWEVRSAVFVEDDIRYLGVDVLRIDQ